MDAGELGPGHGQHFGGGVELHGAAAQRNHGLVEGDVAGFQPAHVAQHLRFRVVVVEQWVLQIVHAALQWLGYRRGRSGLIPTGCSRRFARDGCQQLVDIFRRGGLVQGNAQFVGADNAQVHARRQRALDNGLLLVTHVQGECVEVGRVLRRHAGCLQAGSQQPGEVVHTFGDAPQAHRPVIHGVEGRHDGKQRLGGADVAGGFLPADVLLAGLHGHAQGFVAVAVDRHTDNAPGGGALVGVACGKEGGMWAAKTHGYPKTLGIAHHHIGALGTG